MQIIKGDALEALRQLPDCCCSTCVTSPPYYQLRNYGANGQIGLEETPDEYIEQLVEVFREVRRALKDDGTLWINIGDSYARKKAPGGIKRKDMYGIPWLLAYALRADGFDHNNGAMDPEEELGDALLVLPSHVGNLNGVAAIESTTVRISGEVITELAQALKRNKGSDITVEATNNPHVESCVCCGEIIPEGRQVCPTCERKWGLRE